MVSKRQLNSSKRRLNERIKEVKEFMEQEEKSSNLINAETQIELLKIKLKEYRKELQDFGETLPENEESDTLLNSYEDIYIQGERIETLLQMKINGLKQVREADAIEKERKLLQLEKEKEREMLRLEKERERTMTLQIEKMKLDQEERISLEKLNVEKLRIESETQRMSLELEREAQHIEIRKATITGDTNVNKGTIKLPKLELEKFHGDIFKWLEFWDSYEATIHKSNSLSSVEKFNYLRAQLRNEAKEAITGLKTTEANYEVAVTILQERYGKKQLIINAHYAKLKEMLISSTYYEKLQSTYDSIEKHLRSLEALGENVENNLMMSLLQSKLPKHVLARLEEYKNDDNPWSVGLFRKELKKYITAQEIGNRLTSLNSNNQSRINEPRKPYDQRQPTVAFSTGERQRNCIYCNKGHWSDECKEFPDVPSRKKQISGRCYICLKTGHLLKNCLSTKRCVYCKQERNHHRSLCPKQFETIHTTKEASMVAVGEQVIMQTATVELVNPLCESTERTRLLLDCGSQRSYITQELAERLKLKHIGKNYLTIYTFGTVKPKEIETPIVELGIHLKSGFVMNIKANVVPEVTGEIERAPISSMEIKAKLQTFDLADNLPPFLETTKIHLLIGNDYYTDIVSLKRVEITDSLHLLSSKIGWILTGRIQTNATKKDFALLSSSRNSSLDTLLFSEDASIQSQIEPKLDEFWKLDTIGIKETITETTDDKVLNNFNETVRKVNGRLHVTWPWKHENPDLPENYNLAYGRLKSTVKRMNENSKSILTAYDDILKDQLQKGIIERVNNKTVEEGNIHYIPHHAVITPGKATTKIRIVYDASAKSKKGNKSLNDCMYRGLVLIEDLCGLLLRFRTHKIALVSDIEKAFLQIALQETERNDTFFMVERSHQACLGRQHTNLPVCQSTFWSYCKSIFTFCKHTASLKEYWN